MRSRFQEVRAAYETLSDPGRRVEYDEHCAAEVEAARADAAICSWLHTDGAGFAHRFGSRDFLFPGLGSGDFLGPDGAMGSAFHRKRVYCMVVHRPP